jgi:hypothetical protein
VQLIHQLTTSLNNRVAPPELRLARIAPREYAVLFAPLKKANLQRHSFFQQSCDSAVHWLSCCAWEDQLKNYIAKLQFFFPRFPRFNFTLKMIGEILVLDDKGSSSFSMDKMIFNSKPRWFLWGYPHKTAKSHDKFIFPSLWSVDFYCGDFRLNPLVLKKKMLEK